MKSVGRLTRGPPGSTWSYCPLSTHGRLLMRPRGPPAGRRRWSVLGQRPASSANRKRSDYVPGRCPAYTTDSHREPCPSCFHFYTHSSPSDAADEHHPPDAETQCSGLQLLMALKAALFACIWRRRVDISCHHKLTHDLASDE